LVADVASDLVESPAAAAWRDGRVEAEVVALWGSDQEVDGLLSLLALDLFAALAFDDGANLADTFEDAHGSSLT
jgi:hypothetical protein